GKRHAGKRAELGIAALDELTERRMGEARGDGAVGFSGRRELTAVAVERLTLALIVRGDVDDERRSGAVVDEVVADPVGPPRVGGGDGAAEAARKRGDPQARAGRDVTRMTVVPVWDGDGARTVTADDVHRRSNQWRRRLDAAVGPLQVLA